MRLFKSSKSSTNSGPLTSSSKSTTSEKVSVSSFLSKHYDAVYVSTEEEEDSGPYAPATIRTLSKCKEIPALIAAPIKAQYPNSALSARIRQVTRGQGPPGCKRDSGGSELSVRFADQMEPLKKRHRVGFKSTASEGDFPDPDSKSSESGTSQIAKTTVSCPPYQNSTPDKFDYESYVKYIIKVKKTKFVCQRTQNVYSAKFH